MPMLTTLRIRRPLCSVHAPLRHPAREVVHAVEDRVDAGDDVLAVHLDRRVPRRAQGDVEHRPVLRDDGLLAPEHRVDLLAQAALPREPDQQGERLVGDPVSE